MSRAKRLNHVDARPFYREDDEMKTNQALAAVALASTLCAVSACGSSPSAAPSPQTFTVKGYASAGAPKNETVVGQPCYNTAVRSGEDVVVRGDTGQSLGIGRTESGAYTYSGDTYNVNGVTGKLTECRFPFSVPNISSGQNVYSVTVGRVAPANFSASEITNEIRIRVPGGDVTR